MNLITYIKRQKSFSEKAFGPHVSTERLITHIGKELDEIRQAPDDIEEWVDVIILALDGAWRAGHSAGAIAQALIDKQAKNMKREWPDWRTADPDKPIEHIRAGGMK